MRHFVTGWLVRCFFARMTRFATVMVVKMVRHFRFVRGFHLDFVTKTVVDTVLATGVTAGQHIVSALRG